MLKKEQKQPQVIVRKEFTKHEIDSVIAEVSDWTKNGRTQWLIKKNAIKLQPGYDFAVLQNPDGTFPFTELSLLWEKAKYFANKTPGSILNNPGVIEGYEEMAASMTQSLL